MRYLLRNPELPHQIVFTLSGNDIVVSCNCQRGIDGNRSYYAPIESRTRWEASEALESWREWHQRPAVTVPIGIGRMAS